MFVIVTYDVSQKRVTKVMKISRKYLNYIQNSVFEGMITDGKLSSLKRELSSGIVCSEDSVFVYPSLDRRYLGYDFKLSKGTKTISVCRHNYEKPNYFGSWHCSAIQKIDRKYHIINDGVLNKKDFTILFENDEHKMYIPIETCTSINVYSNVILGSSFLQFINSKCLNVNIFDKYGNFIGSFHSVLRAAAVTVLLL